MSAQPVLCHIPGHHDHDYRDCPDLTKGRKQMCQCDACVFGAEGRERAAPEVVARLIGGHAVQANGEPFDTLAAYMEIAPVVLLWDDGSVTWARQVAIPDTAATAREQR